MPKPLTLDVLKKVRAFRKKATDGAKERVYRRILRRRWAIAYDRFIGRYADLAWEDREAHQSWQNVYRLNLYLARRRVFLADSLADLSSVYAPMPSLGPEATPEKVMKCLIEVDKAIAEGRTTPIPPGALDGPSSWRGVRKSRPGAL